MYFKKKNTIIFKLSRNYHGLGTSYLDQDDISQVPIQRGIEYVKDWRIKVSDDMGLLPDMELLADMYLSNEVYNIYLTTIHRRPSICLKEYGCQVR